MPGQTWLQSASMFMLMWLAMMIAMMLPSSLPMILRYYQARRSDNARGILRSTFLMAAGYFFVWCAVGLVIYLAGIVFALAAMRWSELSRSTPRIIGFAVLLAGCMQFMPWTAFGLRRCRGPLSCNASDLLADSRSAWRIGIASGVSCVACCSGPTLILVVLGMMNPAVIFTVAAVIAVEKLIPNPEPIVRFFGIAALVAGTILMAKLA